jgi:hypothetical protein
MDLDNPVVKAYSTNRPPIAEMQHRISKLFTERLDELIKRGWYIENKGKWSAQVLPPANHPDLHGKGGLWDRFVYYDAEIGYTMVIVPGFFWWDNA